MMRLVLRIPIREWSTDDSRAALAKNLVAKGGPAFESAAEHDPQFARRTHENRPRRCPKLGGKMPALCFRNQDKRVAFHRGNNDHVTCLREGEHELYQAIAEPANVERAPSERLLGLEAFCRELHFNAIGKTDNVEAELIGAAIGGCAKHFADGSAIHLGRLAGLEPLQEYVKTHDSIL